MPGTPHLPDFRRLFEAAPAAYLVLAPDLTILAASDAYLRATLTTRDAVVGRGIFDVFPDNPDDPAATGVANLNASLHRVLATKRPDVMPVQKYDIRRPEAQGGGFEERHWSPVNYPVLGDDGEVAYLLHTVEDVTEHVHLLRQRSEQEEALRELTARSEEEARVVSARLASAVDSIQDAFALFDEKDRLVLCNSAYRSLLGDAIRGPLVGRPFEELIRAWSRDLDFEDDAARERFLAMRLASRRQDAPSTFEVRTYDGRNLRVTDRRTAEGGMVKTIWDLTDDERRAADLREARAAAETASAAKSEFLSSMSHELRTPLNAILGFAQLLQRDKKQPLSDRHRERVDQILKGGEHLLHLIDDILDLSRIEAGGVSMSIEPVSIVHVLDEVREALQPMADRQLVQLELTIVPAPVPMVEADRTRLAQILMNLGSNGIKYNKPEGKVTFTVTTPSPGRVRVTVTDTGIGIPEDKQDKLFQPFQRAGQETGPIQGTGIGLVITRRLARLMRGEVGFRSVAGEGSEFWVELPAHTARAAEGAPSAAREEGARAAVRTERRLVLYVEDNPANVTFMKDLMGMFDDIDLMTAPTAEIGVELARAHRPAIVIMDINLPGMSGIDALHALRAAPETSAIPVIALTAAASERDRHRGEQAGFFRYLTKPIRVDELEAAIEAALAG